MSDPPNEGAGEGTPARKRRSRGTGYSSGGQHCVESPAEKLLARLDGIRESSPGRWYGLCPAHDDKHPSLAITEANDGRLLLFCMSGCSAAEIVAAVGLELRDLFEKPTEHFTGPIPARARFNPYDVLRLLQREGDVLVVASAQLAQGKPLADVDRERLRQANARIRSAMGVIRGRT